MCTHRSDLTGWLVNERFVNIPPQISLPLYDSLRDEMHSACAKGQKFKFHRFLLMSKALKAKGGKKDQDDLIFTNGEVGMVPSLFSNEYIGQRKSFSATDNL